MFRTQNESRTAVLLFARGFERDEKTYGFGLGVDRPAHDAMLCHAAETAGRAWA